MNYFTALVALCTITYVSAQSGRTAFVCEVTLPNFCQGQSNCPSDPIVNFPGAGSFGFEHFNLVSFGGIYAASGDVEGRVLVRNNADLTSYSIGYQLKTAGVSAWDIHLPYSAVFGGNAKWHGGAVLPDGSGFPYAGQKENIFVGTDFSNADSYLQSDRTGSCSTTGCLNNDMDNAQAYYNELSKEFNAIADNAQFTLETWGTITVTCNSMADAFYYIHVTPTQFSTITFWQFSGCNPASGLVVNIVGAGSQVKFAGATQTFFANQRTLYNVVPTSSTPAVRVEVGVNGNLLAPSSVYNQPGMGVFIGQVIVADVQQVLQINLIQCAPIPTGNHGNTTTTPCPSFEQACSGLNFNLGGTSQSFTQFNAIAFGDFNGTTGDVEGRLAVQGNFRVGNGFSAGYELTITNDGVLPYSVIIGRDGYWGSGAVYPQGNGIPYPGSAAGIYVGGNFVASDDLEAQRTGGPCATPGCLDSVFNAAKSCYVGYQNAMATQTDNVQHSISWSTLQITCSDASASQYRVTISPAEFSQFTSTVLSNCNFQAYWTITVSGTQDVEITGGSFPAIPGGVTYNVPGSRIVYIHDTELHGHLLAPQATLRQPNGYINGKVVVARVIEFKQVNKQNTCTANLTITVPSLVTASSSGDVAQVFGSFMAGDNVVYPSGSANVVAVSGNSVTLDRSANLNAGDIMSTQVQSTSSRVTLNDNNSSASAVSVAFAFVLAVICLAL